MNKKILGIVAVIACASSAAFAGFSSTIFHKSAPAKITGDYLETRTASVFCGPCHYNGEAVTVGRDALMAWNISAGTYNGVDLTGLRAVAAVTSDDNLNVETVPHKSELTVDSHATDKQVAAFTDLLREKLGDKLGPIVAVHRSPVSFSRGDGGFTVTAAGFATMNVEYRTDNSCCTMPGLVWYDPISPIANRKVGYTVLAQFNGTVADQWYRSDEDSAFYGTIAF